MPSSILIQFAHPALRKSRTNRYLLEAVQNLENVTINDLYEEYPDFDIDVRREQDLLLAHEIIVFQHPMYWYSTPALLKQWLDLVLEYGFAYGRGGTRLHGKGFLTATTLGGPEDAYRRDGYNYYHLRELLAPIEQTAKLCGMNYLPPFVIFDTLKIPTEEESLSRARTYRRLLEQLRDNGFEAGLLKSVNYINELLIKEPA
jgi:glutathione-regulated potassium-efflux system ancillary protein KefG